MSTITKEIQLPVHGICVTLFSDGSGKIGPDLWAGIDPEDEEVFKAVIDTIESLVLALACAGIDIQSNEFVSGLEAAVESVSNKWL